MFINNCIIDLTRLTQLFLRGTNIFSHIMIGAHDLSTMLASYVAVLAPLDLRMVVEWGDVDEIGVIWRKSDRRWSAGRITVKRLYNARDRSADWWTRTLAVRLQWPYDQSKQGYLPSASGV